MLTATTEGGTATVVDTEVTTAPRLSYERTWDRRRVHRAAVAEVFVTDVVVTGPHDVRVAAQTPPCHGYFGDHVPEPAAIDPLLLMEICRQAGIVTAHELGIAADVALITSEWDLLLADRQVVAFGSATDLAVDSGFEWTRWQHGLPRAGRCRQRVLADGVQIAVLDAVSTLIPRDQLDRVRRAQRAGPPPRTDDLPGREVSDLAEPIAVGRRNPANVVLAALAVQAGRGRARVVPATTNRALFDHSYDHVTMQVLAEAARQLLVAVAGSLPGSARWGLLRQRCWFDRFAELDAELVVSGELTGSLGDPTGSPGQVARMAVAVTQLERRIASFDLDVRWDP